MIEVDQRPPISAVLHEAAIGSFAISAEIRSQAVVYDVYRISKGRSVAPSGIAADWIGTLYVDDGLVRGFTPNGGAQYTSIQLFLQALERA